MRTTVDPETGAIYVRLRDSAVSKTREVYRREGRIVTADLDWEGDVIGVEGIGFDSDSEFIIFLLARSELRSLPMP